MKTGKNASQNIKVNTIFIFAKLYFIHPADTWAFCQRLFCHFSTLA
jgi:hypothetical protein